MFTLKLYKAHSCFSFGLKCKSLTKIQHEVLNVANHRQFTICKSLIFDRKVIYPPSFQIYRFMAGHAKWQNVKHVKAEKDRQKSLMCNKYVRQITAAVKERGPDPKINTRLADIFASARKDNVPSATLESAMKKASSKKFESGTTELLGPGGCMIVFEYETDCLSDMRRMLKQICRKYTVGIYPGGGNRWRSAYEQRGIIRVTSQLNGQPLDSEKMLDSAIEAGAEDVQKIEEDGIFYEFYCAPDDLNIVRGELQKAFVIDEAYVSFLPITTAKLSDEDKIVAMNFLNELGDIPDVSRIFENIE